MEAGQYIRTLAEFATGEIRLPDFKQFVEDRLFELRQKPERTDEKRVLSSVELYLHEAEEGLRDIADIYAIVQFTLDDILLKKLRSRPEYFSPTPTELPYLLSRTFDMDPEHKEKPIERDLSLAVPR